METLFFHRMLTLYWPGNEREEVLEADREGTDPGELGLIEVEGEGPVELVNRLAFRIADLGR